MKEGLEKGVDKYATDKVFQKAMDKAQKEVSCMFFDQKSQAANTFAISVRLTTKILVVF